MIERISLRAEPCACGGVIELREGEDIRQVVDRHNDSPGHREWRFRREHLTETELRGMWGDR